MTERFSSSSRVPGPTAPGRSGSRLSPRRPSHGASHGVKVLPKFRSQGLPGSSAATRCDWCVVGDQLKIVFDNLEIRVRFGPSRVGIRTCGANGRSSNIWVAEFRQNINAGATRTVHNENAVVLGCTGDDFTQKSKT